MVMLNKKKKVLHLWNITKKTVNKCDEYDITVLIYITNLNETRTK